MVESQHRTAVTQNFSKLFIIVDAQLIESGAGSYFRANKSTKRVALISNTADAIVFFFFFFLQVSSHIELHLKCRPEQRKKEQQSHEDPEGF